MGQLDTQDEHIEAVIGGYEDNSFESCLAKFFDYLTANLQLPCDVTGSEDFGWEEYYIVGPGDPKEHSKRRKDRPSSQDL